MFVGARPLSIASSARRFGMGPNRDHDRQQRSTSGGADLDDCPKSVETVNALGRLGRLGRLQRVEKAPKAPKARNGRERSDSTMRHNLD